MKTQTDSDIEKMVYNLFLSDKIYELMMNYTKEKDSDKFNILISAFRVCNSEWMEIARKLGFLAGK